MDNNLKISNTYALYKAGQNKFTNWLKHTADACNKSVKSKKSKSKHASILPNSAVQISDLQGLANTVVRNLSAEDIPYSIVNTLRTVIDRRRESADFFQRQSRANGNVDPEIMSKNKSHTHMIKVLEGVLKVLDDKLRKAAKVPDMNAEPMDQEEAQISNLFDVLDIQPTVEEDSEEENALRELDINASKKKSPRPGKKPKKSPTTSPKSQPVSSIEVDFILSELEYQLVADESDFQVLIYSFIQDFNKIRDYIQERWCDYLEGEVTLMAVSITTNTAFDLFQRAEKELQLQLRDTTVLQTYGDVMKHLFNHDPFDKGYDLLSTNETRIAYPDWDEEMYEKADRSCLPVYQQLKSFVNHFPRGKLPLLNTPDRDYKWKNTYGKTPEDKMSRNIRVLTEFMAEMGMHRVCKKQGMIILAEDEFQGGMIDLFETRNLPLWLVFASQIYLDIRYILEGESDRAHQELIVTGNQLLARLESFERHAPSVNQPSGVKKSIEKITKEMEMWCTMDCIGMDARDDLHKQTVVLRLAPFACSEPYFLLRRHPLYCGLLAFRFSWTVQQISLKIANHWDHVFPAAHLYNVVMQEYILKNKKSARPWQDMEHMISFYEDSHIFVGHRPTSVDEYWRRLELATGTSVTAFSSVNTHMRNGGYAASRSSKGGRWLFHQARAGIKFGKRFCTENGDAHGDSTITLSDIEVMLQKTYDNKGRSTDEGISTDLRSVIRDEHSERSSFVNRQFQQSQILTPLQVLDMLCRALNAEKTRIAFDYLGLHETSTRILLEVYKEFKEELNLVSAQIGAKTYMEEEAGDLPMIARFTLGLMGKAEDEEIVREIVGRVAMAMETGLDGRGDEGLVDMQDMLADVYPFGPHPVSSREEREKSKMEEEEEEEEEEDEEYDWDLD